MGFQRHGQRLVGEDSGIDWGGLGSQLAENIRGLWSSIFAPGEGQENPIRGLYDAIAAALTAIEWGQIGTALAGFGDAAKQAVVDFRLRHLLRLDRGHEHVSPGLGGQHRRLGVASLRLANSAGMGMAGLSRLGMARVHLGLAGSATLDMARDSEAVVVGQFVER